MAVDYNSLVSGTQPDSDTNPTQKWWKLPQADIPASIDAILQFLKTHQGQRQTQAVICSRLYGNQNIMGINGLTYSKVATLQNQLKDRISYNVCQATVDTITSKIAKNKPRPYFLTSGGDYKQQRRAKKLGKFIDGCFYDNDMYKMGTELFRDAAVWGTGVLHVFEQDGRVKVERVLAVEIYVDEVEGFYGQPRQLHRVKNIDRHVLADLYPDHKKSIMEVNRARPTEGAYNDISDQVTVVESWHLPSGKDAKDGCHTITIANACLFKEKYEKDYFPFAFIHWSKRLHGFFGQGLIEQIQNIQLEINKLLWVIQRSMHLAGTFKIWMKTGSKVSKEHLNNMIGAIITGDEQPQYLVPPIVQPEVYQHLQTLKASAFEQAGISQLSAESKKPAGLDSGKALREYNDIETDRFMTVGQAYERFFLDVAKLMINKAKDIYEETGKLSVKAPGRKFIETIDWKDVDLEEDEYVMQIYPVSKLPEEPSGRLQTVTEMMQGGLIDPQTGRRLLDYPDLEAEESLANAQQEWCMKVMDQIIEDGIYNPPEPTMDLQYAQKLALEQIALANCNGLEEEKIDLLRQFNDQINIMLQQAMPPPMAPMPGAEDGAPVPPASPMAPPVSQLIPNINQ